MRLIRLLQIRNKSKNPLDMDKRCVIIVISKRYHKEMIMYHYLQCDI